MIFLTLSQFMKSRSEPKVVTTFNESFFIELVGVFDERDGFLWGLKSEITLLHGVANFT